MLVLAVMLLGCEKENKTGTLPCKYIDYKYYHDEPYPLGVMSGEYILFGSDSGNSDQSIKKFISSKSYFNHDFDYTILRNSRYKYKYGVIKLSRTSSCKEIAWIRNDMEKNQVIDFVHYTMETDDCQNLIWEPMGELCVNSYSSIFYVKVKDTADPSGFNDLVSETNTWISEQNQLSGNYSISTDKNSKGDALEMANYFHESGLFEYSEPGILKLVVE